MVEAYGRSSPLKSEQFGAYYGGICARWTYEVYSRLGRLSQCVLRGFGYEGMIVLHLRNSHLGRWTASMLEDLAVYLEPAQTGTFGRVLYHVRLREILDGHSSMHVLTLTPFYPTAEDDASGCFIAELVGELPRRGIESSVIAVQPMHHSHPGPDPKAPLATWKKYFCLPGNPGLSSAGQFLHEALKFHVRPLHARQPISLIHAHAALPCGQAAMLLAKDLSIPFVVTVHGFDAFSTRQVPGWFGRRCSAVSEQVYGAAARVVCISEQVARRVREALGDSVHISVVYNGVDPSLFTPASGSAAASEVILSVGNLIPIKGHDLLLRSVAAIAPSHPEVQCRIIGDGPERARLQQLVRQLRIEDRVHFLGRRPRSEVAAEMRNCTLFALPSWYEGLGCVYLEAMSAERPAIACRGQGIEEIIRHGENGWLVEPKNLDDLTAALRALLSDRPLRDKLGRNGRRTVLQGYTSAHQVTHLLAIYRECLG